MNLRAVLIGAVAVTALATGSAAQPSGSATVHNSDLHFTLHLPPGWSPVPATRLAQIQSDARRMSGNQGLEFAHAFYRSDGAADDLPYVVVQVKAAPVDLDDIPVIEKSIVGIDSSDIAEAVKKNSHGIQVDVRMAKPKFDRAVGRFIMPLTLTGPNGAALRGVSHGFVGTRGVVCMHCYATEHDFATDKVDFDALAGSLMFDSGYSFADIGKGPDLWSEVLKYGMIGGLTGLGVGVVRRLVKG